MNPPHDIANAKDPDVRASLNALRRAAQLARKTAIQTNTSIVIILNSAVTSADLAGFL
ncbi:hypothetical protein [Acidithiobacillus ferriphilus]|uniref:hypothetical protein n=1 Tax=Acidithiobacillus ferriphilus TaxID=1689834 RepID=UPI001D024188|nr:hypothetical protein [Acidithiobacillus ferriphilus]